ncbi:glycoside hydrolase family 3 C-terminal domain-containing protein [Vibrio tritonius]|uniref:Glycoside hydrolase family 3 C-terminal domain-containing protein n=1 Tax=Vibrio tritonius TaxID=1435069 RepID=A0ABS7YPL6_9VIBR|nr:glycoside hydrolase family 3 C-terminal domain-containing protein [Vibrio tritonius]MCA2016205.1 glycoside hydrolase family 3 C-terminal domain-containing protein [Vibrio tritonius]
MKLSKVGSLVSLAILVAPMGAQADYNGKTWAEVEARVSAIADNMSQSEKYSFIRVDDGHMIPTNSRFGIDGTVAYDSSMGVYVNRTIFGASYPSQTLLAATWDINRAKQLGMALAYETRSAGGEQVLSPVVNLYRTPFNGRTAESICGEDPFLCAVMAPAITNGIQVQGVQAGAKHLIANEQEANRHYLDVNVDERTLREMYLVPFESLVKNADIASIMCGFNKINGEYACENHHIITDILKGEWGYQGFVLSDFNSIQHGFEGAWAGTDLDMPSGLKFTESTLQPYVESGALTQNVIDDKVKRNLRALVRYGFDEATYSAHTLDYPEYGQEASLDAAREGIVLLKNESGNNGKILPLSKSAKVAVIGDFAQQAPTSPYGTANSDPDDNYVTELAGLQQLNTNANNVTFIKSMSLTPSTALYVQPDCTSEDDTCEAGVTAEYFDNTDLSGEPVLTRKELGINFDWTAMTNEVVNPCTDDDSDNDTGLDCSSIPSDAQDGVREISDVSPTQGAFSVRLTGKLRPTIDGVHVFKVRADGPFKLYMNGDLLMESDGEPRASDVPNAVPVTVKTPKLEAGSLYSFRLEYSREQYFQSNLGGLNGIQFSWASLVPPTDLADYDAVVAVVGSNYEYEGEGFDPSFDLPDQEKVMLKKVIAANPNTIVVMHGGGAMNMMPWANTAPGILHAWYSGQYGGQALAEILYGDVNPSGKLPITLDKRVKFNPSYASYSDPDEYVGDDAKTSMTYSEGLFFGYRGYEVSSHKPLYPFGFGLSYTDFIFSDMSLSTSKVTGDDVMYANFTVTNTGGKAGYAVPQLYIAPLSASVERPEHELKGFSKIYLEAGASKTVSIPLNARSFAYYVKSSDSWVVDPGTYRIEVGDSSDNILLSNTMKADDTITLTTQDSNPLPGPLQLSVQVDKSEAYAY